MESQKRVAISKHVLDQIALIFLRHPGQAYSRADIQRSLGVSKPTACRAILELTQVLGLEEVREGRLVYYRLPESEACKIKQSIDFILTISDKEQLALSFLLSFGKSSNLFSNTISELEAKLKKAGLLLSTPDNVLSKENTVQKIDLNNLAYADTLITAAETKTQVEILYKSPFSPEERVHILWPVGLYIRDGNLYLYAYDPKYESATSYAFSRIKELSLIYDEHYSIPEGVSMSEALKDPFGVVLSKPQKVRVHISSKQAYYEKEKQWPEGTTILECDDGSIDMDLTISDPYACLPCMGIDLVVKVHCEYSSE